MSLPDVALVAPYPPGFQRHGGSSGVASYTANLAEALAGRGAAVKVIAPIEPEARATTRNGNVTVERPYARGPLALSRACNAALRSGAPVVHVQHEHFLFGGATSVPALVPALGRMRSAGRGPVLTMHQVVHPGAVDRSYTRLHRVRVPAPVARLGLTSLQKMLVGRADACIVHEPSFVESLPGAIVIPHGIEAGSTLPKRDAREQLGLEDRFFALCFGFVAPYKGLELALEAARHTGPEVQLVIAGGEHPRLAGRDPYASQLRSRYPEATFTGHVPDHDVGTWFRAADVVLLLHPRPHGSSGALALALAHGTPILVSRAMADTAINRWASAPARASDLVAPDEPRALAERLEELAADPGRCSELRAASEPLIADRTWPEVADAHLALYEEVRSCPRP